MGRVKWRGPDGLLAGQKTSGEGISQAHSVLFWEKGVKNGSFLPNSDS